jgi:integrase
MRSRLAEAGADIETAKRLLGHTSDAMSEHYDHADHMDELTAAIEAAAKK